MPSGSVIIDGLGIGDVGNVVLRDRKLLSQDGLFIVVVTLSAETGELVSDPEIISRGFVYMRESTDLLEAARRMIIDIIDDCVKNKITEWTTIKGRIKKALRSFLYDNTKRNPYDPARHHRYIRRESRMLVYDKASELADEIKKSGEYTEYARLKALVTAEEKTKSLLADYKKLQLEAQAGYLTGKEPEAETMEKLKKLGELLTFNKDVTAFFAAEYKFQTLISDVYRIIGDACDMGLDFLSE